MKIAAPVILAAMALALAGPAVAKTSLSKGAKLCKAEVAKLAPAPQNARVDDDETRTSDTHLWFTLNVRSAEGVPGKLSCVVDRQAETAQVSPK